MENHHALGCVTPSNPVHSESFVSFQRASVSLFHGVCKHRTDPICSSCKFWSLAWLYTRRKEGEAKKGKGGNRLDCDSVSLCELVQSCDLNNNSALVHLHTVPGHHERQMRLSQAYWSTYFHFLASFDDL